MYKHQGSPTIYKVMHNKSRRKLQTMQNLESLKDTIYTKIAGGQAIFGGEEDCHVPIDLNEVTALYFIHTNHKKDNCSK